VAGPTVAELNVEINAKSDGLKASVREAKGELDGLEKAAESTAKKGGDAFSRFGEGIERQTAGVRKFTGALSSAAGIATGLVGVFTLLTAGIKSAIANQKAFIQTVRESSKALQDQVRIGRIQNAGYTSAQQSQIDISKQAVDATEQVTNALEDQIGRLNILANLVPLGFLGIESEVELIERARSEIAKIRRAESEAITLTKRARIQEAREVLDAQIEAIELSFLNETDKIREAAKVRKEELKRAAIEAGLEAEDVTLQAALESINRRRDADIAAIEEARKIKEQADAEALKKKEQQEIESAQRAARAAREAFRSELEGVTEAIFGSGGNSFTTRLDTLVRGVSALRSEIRGLK